ncbi:spore coat protein [Ornithinibacillus xuwenensis]|uniref:Spore coat protein n=1 Tax=Ornithinibacillus xuwenensis TaxID=3144668 RepID=A0ABU9XJH4_9BACI
MNNEVIYDHFHTERQSRLFGRPYGYGFGRPRPFGYGFGRPYGYGYGFGGPFLGGVLGGLLGSAIISPYGYGYGYPYYSGFRGYSIYNNY